MALISKDYLESENCIKEMLLAHERRKVIIPLLLENVKPWPPEDELAIPLAGVVYIKTIKLPDKGYGELLSQIRKFKSRPLKPRKSLTDL